MAMPVEKVRKYLDKMLEEDGVCGYAVDGDRIVVFVEDQRAADSSSTSSSRAILWTFK